MQRVALQILLDGVGWQQAQRIGFLQDLCPHRRALRTVLGYSCAAVPTILSGRMPCETGRWAMWYWAPQTSPFRAAARWSRLPTMLRHALGLTRQRLVGDFKARRQITDYCAVYQIPDDLLPYVDTCVGRSLYEPHALDTVETVFDRWERRGLPYRAYGYPRPDQESLQAAERDLRSGQVRVAFLHLYETDAFLHAHCTEPAGVQARLAECAEAIRRLYRVARETAEEVDLLVFSDHGMSPVVGRHDLMADLAGLPVRAGRDYVALFDSTMARFWFLRPAAEGSIQSRLAEATCGRTLPEAELERLGVRFPDHRFGDLVFLMHPGWVIAPSHMGSHPPAGMHGFHPDEDPDADALLASTQPIPDRVAHIADLRALMETTVGKDGRS